MKFWEAMKALAEGKRIRVAWWGSEQYLESKGNLIVDNKGNEIQVLHLNHTYELYQESIKVGDKYRGDQSGNIREVIATSLDFNQVVLQDIITKKTIIYSFVTVRNHHEKI